jgi:hypothetical protein
VSREGERREVEVQVDVKAEAEEKGDGVSSRK